MAEGLTGAVSDVVSIMTTNVVPLVTATPFVYFFGLTLFGMGCVVFRKVRKAIH